MPLIELVVIDTEDDVDDCMLERAGTGGITGRASCASSELTTPRLGARMRDDMVVTLVLAVLGGVELGGAGADAG